MRTGHIIDTGRSMGQGIRRRFRGTPSWSVCSMVAEPLNLLCAFAAHYRELGAEEVHLFLDDPTDEAVETLSAIDGVRVTACTEAYWQEVHGARPPRQIMRQLKTVNRGYAECRTDWFFFCDADEFLVPGRPVGELLAGVPGDVPFVRPHMAERAFPADRAQRDLFDGVLRKPLPGGAAALRAIYGDMAPMLTRGLLGHVIGKSFVRAGRDDLRIRIHFPVPRDAAAEEALKASGALQPGPWLDEAWLVHFDGLTPLHWTLKLLRYYLAHAPLLDAGNRGVFKRRTAARSRQLNAVYEARGDAAALAKLLQVARPSPEIVARLRAAGGLLDLPLDPAEAAWRRSARDLDFAPEAFDARLRARHGDLIDTYGIAG